MKRIICILLLFAALPVCSRAQSRNAVETSTDILMFLPSGVGGVVSLAEGDYKGLLQHIESGAVTVATTYLLKYAVKNVVPTVAIITLFHRTTQVLLLWAPRSCNSATAGSGVRLHTPLRHT